MKQIHEYILHHSITQNNIRQFVKMICITELDRYQFSFAINTAVRWLPRATNGLVVYAPTSTLKTATIVLNYSPFLRLKKHTSDILIWYYIYATVVHELEHIRLSQLCQKNQPSSYVDFMAATQQHLIVSGSTFVKKIKASLPSFHESKRHKSAACLFELVCTQKGYRRAYHVLQSIIPQDQIARITAQIQSLDLICENLEITYNNSAQPYNAFYKILLMSQRKYKKKHGSKMPPLLNRVLTDSADLRDPIDIYQHSLTDTTGTYNEILIRYFLHLNFNWTKLFHTEPALKNHIETLTNQYKKQCIQYIKNQHTGEIFLEKEILKDNELMLIKNISYLNKLMEKYELTHTTGSIIGL